MPISGTDLGTVRIPLVLNDLEDSDALMAWRDACNFSYLRSTTMFATDNCSAPCGTNCFKDRGAVSVRGCESDPFSFTEAPVCSLI